MPVQFGDDESYRRLMLVLTGAAVCVIVVSMSIYMIAHATKEIKKLQRSEIYRCIVSNCVVYANKRRSG